MDIRKTKPSSNIKKILGFSPVIAQGGVESTITFNNIQYRLHVFSNVGSNTFRVIDSGTIGDVEVLVVAGGGGGGMDMGGGGGGGGVIFSRYTIKSGENISLSVGAGGLGGPGGSERRSDNTGPNPGSHQFTISATNGSNSTFGNLTAIGGGYGGSSYFDYTPNNGLGAIGGCGGGTSGYSNGASNTKPGAAGTAGQGYKGGQGGGQYYSGGGGGAGGPGVNSTSIPHGGPGMLCDILGYDLYWGGGGGGAAYSVSPGGNGGVGGGGGGAVGSTIGGSGYNPGQAGGGGSINSQTNTRGGNGGTNTGGGGGGGSHYNISNSGGDGGSGIVIVRYPLEYPLYSSIITNGLMLNLDATNPLSYPGTGNTWFDLSPNKLHATGSSAITNQALQANQPYTTATTPVLDTDTHSLFFSIQINGSSETWDKIFGYTPSGTDRSPGIWRYPSNKVIHWRYDPGNSGNHDFSSTAIGTYPASGTEFVNNTWYYVGVTKNGATVKIYVNGNLIGTSTAATNPKTIGSSTIQLYPGYTQNTSLMRHVHLYNRVLSDAEVLSNYNLIKNTLI